MREVQSQEWDALCRRINEFEGGAVVTLEQIDRAGLRSELARDAVFEQMRIERKDACNDRIAIQRTDGRNEVVEPISVRLTETEAGRAFDCVVIEGEEGTTMISFRPVIRAEWLQDLHLR